MDIISSLRKYLPRFKKVLELGSKKGDDLGLLHSYYEVVASEDEKVKTRFLKDEFIDIRVILIDKVTIDTHKKFDAIFSRNTLDSLSLVQLNDSLKNQKNILNKEGLIFHILDKNKIEKNEVLTLLNENYELLEEGSFDNNFFFIAKLS